MQRTKRSQKPTGRDERRSAAWGKRLSIMLLLMTSMAFGQGRVAPDLSGLLAKAQHGSSDGKTVKVIVQYRQTPSASHYATMLARGAHLNAKLHMIQGAAFTIPARALADLANDPEVTFVSLDHPLK